MKRMTILFCIILVSNTLACNLVVKDFTFTAKQKIEISTAFFDKLFNPKNIIQTKNGKGSSPYFFLKRFYETQNNQAFFISIKNSGLSQMKLCLNSKNQDFEYIYTIKFPDFSSNFQIRLDLPDHISIRGFQINIENQEGQLEIIDAGITGSLFGFYYEGNSLIYNPDMIINSNEYDFSNILKKMKQEINYLQLDYNYIPSEDLLNNSTSIKTFLQSDFNELLISLLPKSGNHKVYFHPGMIQFNPSYFYFESLPNNFQITGFKIIPQISQSEKTTLSPLPADLGTIYHYEKKNWRNSEFELFSWNLNPKVLILDTADYEVQSRFFKRLAFFTEKKGFIGKVLNNKDIEYRMGWNAHDYRAEDLAKFFTIATAQNTELYPEEWLLKDVLISQSIINQRNNEYTPLSGAIISVSRSSGENLRQTLLAHEALHGVFFTNAEFRMAVQNLWDGKPDLQKEMWKHFFSTLSYNSEDDHLMANEYMAYLLQYNQKDSYAYLNNYKFPQAASRHPEWENIILGPIQNNPDLILNMHKEMEKIAYKTAGLKGGFNACLEIP